MDIIPTEIITAGLREGEQSMGGELDSYLKHLLCSKNLSSSRSLVLATPPPLKSQPALVLIGCAGDMVTSRPEVVCVTALRQAATDSPPDLPVCVCARVCLHMLQREDQKTPFTSKVRTFLSVLTTSNGQVQTWF